jgi:hypothetical protein
MLGSISLKLIFAMLAVVFFGLAFFGVPKYGWQWGACAFVVLAFMV